MMDFGSDLRSRYPDAGRCTHVVDGLPRPAESITVRAFNFGQDWRTEGVEDVEYRVEIPRSFVLDLLREQMPDYIEDSRAHFDPDSEIDRALEAAGWPSVDEALEGADFLRLFVDFYGYEILIHWFGDGEPERAPGFVLNTIDEMDVASMPDRVSFRGLARRSGIAARYQDW